MVHWWVEGSTSLLWQSETIAASRIAVVAPSLLITTPFSLGNTSHPTDGPAVTRSHSWLVAGGDVRGPQQEAVRKVIAYNFIRLPSNPPTRRADRESRTLPEDVVNVRRERLKRTKSTTFRLLDDSQTIKQIKNTASFNFTSRVNTSWVEVVPPPCTFQYVWTVLFLTLFDAPHWSLSTPWRYLSPLGNLVNWDCHNVTKN